MSLQNTLLGFLSYGPMTGYELKKALDQSTQLFWHAELSQIYPALKQLQSQGLVVGQTLPQTGKPDKICYAITDAGQEAFRRWLLEPLDEVPAIKNPVLLKLFFAGSLEKEQLLHQLRCQLVLQRARLQRLEQETAASVQELSQDDQEQAGRMWEQVRRFGVMQVQTTIEWLEDTIRAVEEKS